MVALLALGLAPVAKAQTPVLNVAMNKGTTMSMSGWNLWTLGSGVSNPQTKSFTTLDSNSITAVLSTTGVGATTLNGQTRGGPANSGSFTMHDLYYGFAFGGSSTAGTGFSVSLSGTGVTANSAYTITVYGYDNNGSVNEFFSTDAAGTQFVTGGTKTASSIISSNSHSFTTNDGYASLTFTLTSDATGTLKFYCLNTSTASGNRLNGFSIAKPVASPLAADAGANKTISPPATSVQIGGSPTATGGTGPYTYLWSPTTGLSSATVANPTASPNATTTYTVTVTDSLSAQATSSVTVNYPLAAYAGSAKLCTPSSPSATIGGSPTGNGGTGPYTYSWTSSPAGFTSTNPNPTVSPTTTTTYTVTVTDSASPTPATATASVVVTYAIPDPNLISVDFVYSSGSTPASGNTVLTAPANPTTDPNMQNAAGLIFTGQVGSWNAVNLGGNNASVNSASLTNLVNGAGATTTVAFKMGHATSAGASGGDWRNNGLGTIIPGSLRQEQSYTYYPGLPTANHYNWELTGLVPNAHYQLVMFGNFDSNFTNIANTVGGSLDTEGDWNWSDIQADGSGMIAGNLLYTQSANDTRGMYGLQLYKIPVPLAADAGPDKGVTPGTPAVLGGSPAASGGTPPYTYSWSPTTGLDNPTAANPSASPTSTTTYTLTVTDSASPTPGTATDTVVVTYAPPLVADAGPNATVTPASPSATLGGTTVASGGTGPYTYAWTPIIGLNDPTSPHPVASPTVTTTYYLTVTDSLNATANSQATVTYTVPPLVANAGANKTYNPGVPVSLGGTPTASGGSTVYTYSWSPTTGLSDPTAAHPTASPSATTTYTLTVTDSFGTTPATSSVVVTFTVLPLVANAGANVTVSPLTPSAVIGGSPSASGGSLNYTYSWSPGTGLSDATVANPTASPTTTTTYTLTVTDDLGTPAATSSVVVTYTVPNPNLISVDFIESGGTPCSGDTTLTGSTMKNAVGNIFTGQLGAWNSLNIGTYNTSTATSGFLKNGGGTTTTAKLVLGLATGLDSTAAGGWRCSPNEGATGGADQLRSESAYLYNGVITGDHYAWAFTGLKASTSYKLTFFGDQGNSTGASNVANGVAGTLDSEGDWNWTTVTTDASGTILGTFTAPNPTLGLYGAQIEELPPTLTGYALWASTHAGGQSASGDYNNDGVSNGVAYFMGVTGVATNPAIINGKVTWPHDPSAVISSYGVQVSANLVDWSPADSADVDEVSSPGFLIYTFPTGPGIDPKKFCRLQVTP